jgi:hypothetical protein
MIDANGYVRVKVVPGKGYWVPEHHLVMAQVVGRPLVKGEVVHHINGDRADNSPSNLFLCRDSAHHNEVHRSEAAALRVLLAAGVVVFRDGRYTIYHGDCREVLPSLGRFDLLLTDPPYGIGIASNPVRGSHERMGWDSAQRVESLTAARARQMREGA